MAHANFGPADFNAHARGERRGQPKPRAKNFENQRVAGANQFHAASGANAERFQPLCVFIVRFDVADDSANARRQIGQADEIVGFHFLQIASEFNPAIRGIP